MSIKIRLSKTGRKNAHSFRIVVTNTRSKRDGKPLDRLGYYNPSVSPVEFKLDESKYEEWVNKGAQVSDAVKSLRDGEYEFKKYSPNAKEETKEEAPADVEESPAPKEETTTEDN